MLKMMELLNDDYWQSRFADIEDIDTTDAFQLNALIEMIAGLDWADDDILGKGRKSSHLITLHDN